MQPWLLYDYTDPVEDESLFPQVAIASENDLRERLRELAQKRPGTAVLKSPDSEYLEMSIGGPLAALVWTKSPASSNNISVVSQTPFCDTPRPFRDQGMPTYHKVEDLLPVEEIIEAAVHYFNTRQLATWMQWRAWNPKSNAWEIKAATSVPPRSVAVSR